ncbi:hypothetical protein [Trinickia acidisoli]|uniref:hypothetical protein n=1 Tax=Trinickia acidisoli TaxID=2767482 RepID=UPI001A8D502D|nr:hypothetical protein [Trinickia acidisoli]
MEPRKIQFTVDELSHWAGMSDYVLIPPDRSYKLALQYEGEPPNGDSYHLVTVGSRQLPGYAWGSIFSMSACSSFVAFSWMERKFERLTAIVDVRRSLYFALPVYIYHPRIEWPFVQNGATSGPESYTFVGSEVWRAF